MLHEFKDGWVQTKDSFTVKALIYLQEGRAVAALSSCIIAWSEDEPINEYNVGRLKARIGDKILRRLLAQYNEVLEKRPIIERLARLAVNKVRLTHDENRELYEKLRYLLPCLSPWGGFAHLPEEGGLLDQRGDLIIFLLALQDAFSESARKKGR